MRDRVLAKLGMSDDSTNAELLAEVDARLAHRRTASQSKPVASVNDLLSALAFGDHTDATRTLLEPPPQRLTVEDQALYELAFGDDG